MRRPRRRRPGCGRGCVNVPRSAHPKRTKSDGCDPGRKCLGKSSLSPVALRSREWWSGDATPCSISPPRLLRVRNQEPRLSIRAPRRAALQERLQAESRRHRRTARNHERRFVPAPGRLALAAPRSATASGAKQPPPRQRGLLHLAGLAITRPGWRPPPPSAKEPVRV